MAFNIQKYQDTSQQAISGFFLSLSKRNITDLKVG